MLSDLRYALRTLARSPGLTAAAVLRLALGVAGALAGGRAVGALLFDVRPHDPLVLAACAAVLLTVAALASYLPARRATRLDPARVLRAD